MMMKHSFLTRTRDELIDLSRSFGRHVKGVLENDPGLLVVEINGDYAAGKSLVADAMKAELFSEEEIEKARWKRCVNYEGSITGRPSTVSFVNARYDLLHFFGTVCMRQRQEPEGVIFVSNRPKVDMSHLLTRYKMPDSSVKIEVKYTEGEIRNKQIGPFKWGAPTSMGRRDIVFASKLEAPLGP